VNNIVRPILAELTEEEELNSYVRQNSSTAHKKHVSPEELRKVFDDRIISGGLWPPRSPDLTLCDFCLCGSLKDKVCKINPHTL
jgi:hypothetical protein